MKRFQTLRRLLAGMILAGTVGQLSPLNASDSPAVPTLASIPQFALTNELGRPFSFRALKGQAVAMTFFFTRCPIPEFCPRLTRNFVEASRQLAAFKNATNWHLISVSIDPADTPEVLRQYARRNAYDSNHWTFLTGKPSDIRALSQGFGLHVTASEGGFSHDFRTVVFDATGRVQAMWPLGGNTSDLLVRELRKGAAATEPADPPHP